MISGDIPIFLRRNIYSLLIYNFVLHRADPLYFFPSCFPLCRMVEMRSKNRTTSWKGAIISTGDEGRWLIMKFYWIAEVSNAGCPDITWNAGNGERASEERLLLARFLEERRGRGGASGDAARKQVQGKTFGFVALKLMWCRCQSQKQIHMFSSAVLPFIRILDSLH